MFKEIQKFRQVWLWVLLIALFLLTLRDVFRSFLDNESAAKEISWPSVLGVLLMLIIMAFLFFFQLETRIDENGIFYRWIPFQQKFSRVEWEKIEKLAVVKYRPLAEYGGWGIRFGYRGRANNVSGNMGLEIFIIGKKKTLLIGTQKPAELSAFLENSFPDKLVG